MLRLFLRSGFFLFLHDLLPLYERKGDEEEEVHIGNESEDEKRFRLPHIPEAGDARRAIDQDHDDSDRDADGGYGQHEEGAVEIGKDEEEEEGREDEREASYEREHHDFHVPAAAEALFKYPALELLPAFLYIQVHKYSSARDTLCSQRRSALRSGVDVLVLGLFAWYRKGTNALSTEKIRINKEIRASELRVVGAEGENLGVLSFADALKAAEAAGLDLIEISPNAKPPVAKVMDYGKFQYELKKRESAARSKAKVSETKEVQIKVGTGENDMRLKANKAAEWLAEGHRVRAELFLKGRYKGMEEAFLKSRLEKFLLLIPFPYKIAEPITRAPKGFAGIIERDAKAGVKPATQEKGATEAPATN